MWIRFLWYASQKKCSGLVPLDNERDGPHLPASGEQLIYLKRRITLREDGILIQPNATSVLKLEVKMKMSGRRKKGLPYHATLLRWNLQR